MDTGNCGFLFHCIALITDQITSNIHVAVICECCRYELYIVCVCVRVCVSDSGE